ncbi:hypothetical protein D9M68_656400 [compost metagenome]
MAVAEFGGRETRQFRRQADCRQHVHGKPAAGAPERAVPKRDRVADHQADAGQEQTEAGAGDEVGNERAGEPAHAEHDAAFLVFALMRIGRRDRRKRVEHGGKRRDRLQRRMLIMALGGGLRRSRLCSGLFGCGRSLAFEFLRMQDQRGYPKFLGAGHEDTGNQSSHDRGQKRSDNHLEFPR